MKEIKNVVITGASQGIGKALAFEYASQGANLVLLSRSIDAIREISNNVKAKGVNSFYLGCDVSVHEQMKEAIHFALRSLGRIDLAILNAGVSDTIWMEDFRSANFKKVVDVNLFGIANGLEYLIPVMKEQGGGIIAGVTSMADTRGYPGSSSYAASKAAASILLESARVELKKYNIKVITVRPGFVKTAMTDKNEFKMPFLMEVDKAAKIIRKGIEKGKSVVQFPFPLVMLAKVVKFLPNWIYDWGINWLRPKKET